ncbi:10834_t:CDS:2 [Rhizophagus irregularis]|nr:10834_t:CDS:2 [Rhizophagus irregularis]
MNENTSSSEYSSSVEQDRYTSPTPHPFDDSFTDENIVITDISLREPSSSLENKNGKCQLENFPENHKEWEMLIGEFSGKPFNIDVNKVYKDRYTKTVYVSTVSAKTMTNKMQK